MTPIPRLGRSYRTRPHHLTVSDVASPKIESMREICTRLPGNRGWPQSLRIGHPRAMVVCADLSLNLDRRQIVISPGYCCDRVSSQRFFNAGIALSRRLISLLSNARETDKLAAIAEPPTFGNHLKVSAFKYLLKNEYWVHRCSMLVSCLGMQLHGFYRK